jgi:predicted nucleic acid-binding Zn ribbon protein
MIQIKYKIILCLLLFSITPSIYSNVNIMVEKKCLNCGNRFEVINSREDSAKYCSKVCANEKLKGELNTVCTECGELFHLKESSKKDTKELMAIFVQPNVLLILEKKHILVIKILILETQHMIMNIY